MNGDAMIDVTFRSLRFAATACLIIFPFALGIGYWLARTRSPWRRVVETLVILPTVLPPVAVGLVLLHLLSRRSVIGRTFESLFGEPLLLSPAAAVLAAAVMSFPLLVLGVRQGFASVPRRLEQVAATLGAGPWRIFRRVQLPLAARGIAQGLVYAFVRGLGEFGATTLVAGRIPGRTETLSLAIYDRIQSFEDGEAFQLAAISVALALGTIIAASLLWRRAGEP